MNRIADPLPIERLLRPADANRSEQRFQCTNCGKTYDAPGLKAGLPCHCTCATDSYVLFQSLLARDNWFGNGFAPPGRRALIKLVSIEGRLRVWNMPLTPATIRRLRAGGCIDRCDLDPAVPRIGRPHLRAESRMANSPRFHRSS